MNASLETLPVATRHSVSSAVVPAASTLVALATDITVREGHLRDSGRSFALSRRQALGRSHCVAGGRPDDCAGRVRVGWYLGEPPRVSGRRSSSGVVVRRSPVPTVRSTSTSFGSSASTTWAAAAIQQALSRDDIPQHFELRPGGSACTRARSPRRQSRYMRSQAGPTAEWSRWPSANAIRSGSATCWSLARPTAPIRWPPPGAACSGRSCALPSTAVGRKTACSWRVRSRCPRTAARKSSAARFNGAPVVDGERFVFPVESYLFSRGGDYASALPPRSLSVFVRVHRSASGGHGTHLRTDDRRRGSRGSVRPARRYARNGCAPARRPVARNFLDLRPRCIPEGD